jgi:NAD(P)-dependent dehydrogenase (short-subunit alcohol dehydrogenase family)
VTHPSQQVALVTGSAGGIGASTTGELRRRGWLVAGLDRSPSPDVDLDIIVDVTDIESMRAAFHEICRELGPVTGVVSAAGYVEEIPLADISTLQLKSMLRTHLRAFGWWCRLAAPDMRQRGGGHIVSVSSEMALAGGDDALHYVAAKGALLGLTRALAAEFAPDGVAVNCVAPGPTDTAMIAPDTLWRNESYLSTLPSRGLVRPSEIARTIAFLLGGRANISGQVISPNAGTVL